MEACPTLFSDGGRNAGGIKPFSYDLRRELCLLNFKLWSKFPCQLGVKSDMLDKVYQILEFQEISNKFKP
jgi:hypothetical protein